MSESLAWLRDPETEPALGALLCGLIRDIRLILVHPDLGNAAKLGAITQTVDQLAPPPGPEAGDASAAASVAALLTQGTGTATALFEKLGGEQIRVDLTGSADRPLTATECLELLIRKGAHGHQRTGTLRTANSGRVAAEVTSLVLPGRLPADARWALGIPGPGEPAPPPSGIPLGKVLAGFGGHREALGARMVYDSTVSPNRVSVESSSRMWLDGVPVALASERVTAEFCQRARARLASTRAARALLTADSRAS